MLIFFTDSKLDMLISVILIKKTCNNSFQLCLMIRMVSAVMVVYSEANEMTLLRVSSVIEG